MADVQRAKEDVVEAVALQSVMTAMIPELIKMETGGARSHLIRWIKPSWAGH